MIPVFERAKTMHASGRAATEMVGSLMKNALEYIRKIVLMVLIETLSQHFYGGTEEETRIM
jgi:hypothetical protein